MFVRSADTTHGYKRKALAFESFSRFVMDLFCYETFPQYVRGEEGEEEEKKDIRHGGKRSLQEEEGRKMEQLQETKRRRKMSATCQHCKTPFHTEEAWIEVEPCKHRFCHSCVHTFIRGGRDWEEAAALDTCLFCHGPLVSLSPYSFEKPVRSTLGDLREYVTLEDGGTYVRCNKLKLFRYQVSKFLEKNIHIKEWSDGLREDIRQYLLLHGHGGQSVIHH